MVGDAGGSKWLKCPSPLKAEYFSLNLKAYIAPRSCAAVWRPCRCLGWWILGCNFGASIGGPFAPITGAVGGIIGGVVGYFAGSATGEAVYEEFEGE